MNRIIKYQESIVKFLKSKSCFVKLLKTNKIYDDIINTSNHILPIVLLSVLNNQTKNKDLKSYHGHYMASGIDIMMVIVLIFDNENYYYTKFGKENIMNFLLEMPIHINKCLAQNLEILDNIISPDIILKIFHNTFNIIQTNMLLLMKKEDFIIGDIAVNKTDIIKFHFKDKTLLKTKYKNLKQFDMEKINNYIENKYGSVCKCSLLMGFLLSANNNVNDNKKIERLEQMGKYLGYILKISNDFINLERDIKYSDVYSNNYIVNYGIHSCFSLFVENKIKLIEGFIELNIYTNTIKELIEYVENNFDNCLNNTDIELQSMYSSFTDSSNTKKSSDVNE